jgi:hypothetical protein
MTEAHELNKVKRTHDWGSRVDAPKQITKGDQDDNVIEKKIMMTGGIKWEEPRSQGNKKVTNFVPLINLFLVFRSWNIHNNG